MRLLLIALALLIAGPAFAQPPLVVEPEDSIEMAVGESRTLKFGEAFQSASTVTKGVAELIPQSDKTLTVAATGPGQTLMIVNRKGEPSYVASIVVTPSAGKLVKVYGNHHGIKDFVGVYCSETSCGRADLDKKLANQGRDPDEPTAVTITRPTGDGGSISQRYGR